MRTELDSIDRSVLAGLPDGAFGATPDGTWATTGDEARRRLDHFVEKVLPGFGPHEDAMLAGEWAMAHATLSPYLNLGLLMPQEVCDAVEAAYRDGKVPIQSAEGFVRQVIGWREYVWGVYWLWMPGYREVNELQATRPLPPLFSDRKTGMRCVSQTLDAVNDHGYAHHIQRLMILGNLGLLTGTRPAELVEWMSASFVDAAEWVMLPNVLGMALYADGGQMATKPYAAGGNYINRMSDYCRDCRFDPKRRTGQDACPFTTLYWDFLDRNQEYLAGNQRVARQLAAARRLVDMDAVKKRAQEVLKAIDRGEV